MNMLNVRCSRLSRSNNVHRPSPRRIAAHALSPEALGVGLFFTPGILALVYSAVQGKGNVKDGFSHLVTVLSQGVASTLHGTSSCHV